MGIFVITGLFFSLTCTKVDDGKIPITTSSHEAHKLYLQGLDLADRLQTQESIQYFQKAVAADSNFALAYLNLAFVVPNVKDFFVNLNKAVSLADNVSEGERLWIQGVQAGVNGKPLVQQELYKKLVAAYPQDERALNLLAGNYFGLQEWQAAADLYLQAIQINPKFSQPYNQLGYAYRFLEQYDKAEQAFKKYIELIPNDPNPYDSYAELLLKAGRFDESIVSYQKALDLNPNFVASHVGIANNLNFNLKHAEARQHMQKLLELARNEGERNTAHFTTAISFVDEGRLDAALEEIKKMVTENANINDVAAMAGNLNTMGFIMVEMGKYKQAREEFNQAEQLILNSNLAQDIKDNAVRGGLFNMAYTDLAEGNIKAARVKMSEYRQQVETMNNPNLLRQAHQLAGQLAFLEKDYTNAVNEYQQANLQNPYNLYRLAMAYKGQGDQEKARETLKKAANFNAVNNLNYSFIRFKAQRMLSEM